MYLFSPEKLSRLDNKFSLSAGLVIVSRNQLELESRASALSKLELESAGPTHYLNQLLS
jgi:hypothetical protein